MATFDEIMNAAVNADKAGDAAAAQMLVDLARGQMPQPTPSEPPLVPFPTEGEQSTPQVDRFGDTIRAATEAPLAATQAWGAGLIDQDQSISLQNMPEWVPDALKRPAATVGDTVMTGLSALGTAASFGAGAVGEAIGGSPTQEKKLARDLMMGLEVGVPQLAGATGMTRAATKGAKAAERLAVPPATTQASARAADDLGITPSLGAGGKVRSMTSAALEKVPFSGSVIARDAQRFVGEVESAFEGMVPRVGRAQGAPGAGEALQSGANKFISEFKTKSSGLYSKVGEAIPADTVVQSPKTIEALQEALAPFADTPEIAAQLGMNKWASIAADLEGGLSWKAASDLRSSIGSSIGKMTGPMKDMDQGRLAQVYGTLTADLEQAAINAGPKAEKAWKRAGNYYRRGSERISDALDKTVRADSPERAFEAFEAMTREGRSSANSKRLYKMKSSMPKQEWDTVAASIVDRMGRPTAGGLDAEGAGFSPAKFLTDWNRMSPEAKSILLPPDVRKEMTKLAKVSEGAKRANAERNYSNTGQINAAVATGVGAGFSPGLTASILSGAYVSSRALTNVRMLKALNAVGRGDMRQLRAIERSDSPFAQDAATVLRVSAADAAQGGSTANTDQQPAQIAN